MRASGYSVLCVIGENRMNIDDELQALSEQEATLAFTHFDAATAWELGAALKTAAERRGLSIAIEIQLAGQTLFYYAMPGATPDIADWVRRKRNLVNHFHKALTPSACACSSGKRRWRSATG